MTKHYLFDWGDTLMVDLPNQSGPMCDWPDICVVEGAKECLIRLSQNAQCHLATNAQDSTEQQIRQALLRGELSDYIDTVFCKENLGFSKTDPGYFEKITERLNLPASEITMVGDSLERDIYPALKAGLNAVWFNPSEITNPESIRSISNLNKLILEITHE